MTGLKAFAIALSVVLLSACGGQAATESASKSTTDYVTKDASAFAEAIAGGAVVLDVRRPDEFSAGHIPGAVNINLEDPSFATRIQELDRGATYAVYCHSGRRSAIAADQMVGSGFTSVVNLDGGVQAWVAAGQELVQ